MSTRSTRGTCLGCDAPVQDAARAIACEDCGEATFVLPAHERGTGGVAGGVARTRLTRSSGPLDVLDVLAALAREAKAHTAAADAADAGDRVEVIRVVDRGGFEIRLEPLLASVPVVVEEDGVYSIDLSGAFSRAARRRT